MCDVNPQNICKQMHVYWKNEHFQTLLKNNKGNLDQKVISEINRFLQEIKKNMSKLA